MELADGGCERNLVNVQDVGNFRRCGWIGSDEETAAGLRIAEEKALLLGKWRDVVSVALPVPFGSARHTGGSDVVGKIRQGGDAGEEEFRSYTAGDAEFQQVTEEAEAGDVRKRVDGGKLR